MLPYNKELFEQFVESFDYEFIEKLHAVDVSLDGSTFYYDSGDVSGDLDSMRVQVLSHVQVLEEVKPKRILEIGTHKAQYCYLAKKVLPEVKIVTFGIDAPSQICVDMVNEYYGEDFIEFHCGDSVETLSEYQTDKKFDLAWVDGGHSYEIALSDLTNCARLGIKTILLDDTRTYPNLVGKAVSKFAEECEYRLIGVSDDCRGIAWLEKILNDSKNLELNKKQKEILKVMNSYEVYSKLNIEHETSEDWHENNSDIKWHANYVERFEDENINGLYVNNEYARNTRWNFWNKIVELFLKYDIKSCLDIGCANNQFAFLCNKKNVFSLGIDPRQSCVEISSDIFENNFGSIQFGYVGTLKTFVEFFENNNTDILFDCITVLNFLHGDSHNSNEIKKFFNLLPSITNYAIVSEPKWSSLNLPQMTNNYEKLEEIDNGSGAIHTLYKIN